MKTSTAQDRSLSLAELRLLARPPEFSVTRTDRMYGVVSFYLSLPLSRLGASPNVITVAWIVVGLGGVVALASESWMVRLAGALLLQLSYLLDFVDGEVARLTDQKSRLGPFLDLVGHGLIKTSLPLAVGALAAAVASSSAFLLAGGIGAVSIGVGDTVRFYAACVPPDGRGGLDHAVVPAPAWPPLPLRRLVACFNITLETPGLYIFALVGTLVGALPAVAAYWAMAGPLWFLLQTLQHGHRLAQGR